MEKLWVWKKLFRNAIDAPRWAGWRLSPVHTLQQSLQCEAHRGRAGLQHTPICSPGTSQSSDTTFLSFARLQTFNVLMDKGWTFYPSLSDTHLQGLIKQHYMFPSTDFWSNKWLYLPNWFQIKLTRAFFSLPFLNCSVPCCEGKLQE